MFAEGLLIITKVNFTTCVNGDLHGWIKTTLAEKVSSLDQKIHSLWSYDLQSSIESQTSWLYLEIWKMMEIETILHALMTSAEQITWMTK